ncbi:response regulator [Cohnella herbarum]|uniref:Response regulator n=1 Tax=Cohnella herbarum TaxID=2728023 RepID=A0A7Z2VFN9_9BACL|nr:response regulator [Cohnella herbarum]QJD82075.1 response regulator [Cohnella herbarum]
MIKVMIVDDEAIFRDFLKIVLPWEEYGFTICGEVRNGIEALKMMEEFRPDIALVDINMPFMDGLELSEKLKEVSPGVGIIIVTGHNEFEYARRAIKLGVEDYLLKPFTKEELLLTLLKLQSQIQETKDRQLTLKANEVMLKEGFLNSLIESEYLKNEEIRNRLADFGIANVSSCFQVACIEIDLMDSKWRNVSDRELWKFAVANILSETIHLNGNHMVFNGPEGRIICIYEPEEVDYGSSRVKEGYEQLCILIKKYLKFAITIGLGTLHSSYSGIRASYLEALHALRYKFVIGTDRVIGYDDSVEGVRGFASGFIPSQMNEELLIFLRMGDSDSVKNKIHTIFEGIREDRFSIDYVYTICMGLVSICLSCVSENGHPIEDCFGEEFYPYSDIMQQHSIEGVQRWIIDMYLRAIEYMKQHKQTKSGKIAETAKQLIDKQYMDSELKVETLAQQVYINPSYLRGVFKKNHGMTVTDYITQRRMQEARSLLLEGQYKLSDIAERVGFQDPAYFSRAFKKYYGTSPRDYENKRG